MAKAVQVNPAEPSITVPKHVAVIMDGNGRWARERNMPRRRGHSEGVESVRVVTRQCSRMGVEQLTLYAFSNENWKRPKPEVAFLMELLKRFLVGERGEMKENNIRLCAIGRIAELPKSVQKTLDKSIALTAGNSGMILRLALNYGGRQEILDAARRLAAEVCQRGEAHAADLSEEDIRRCLYDDNMTDPDLLIRTGGEIRLSNFLLWHLSYSELYFTKTWWPDFREAHLRRAFESYAGRERRYGGLAHGLRSQSRASGEAKR